MESDMSQRTHGAPASGAEPARKLGELKRLLIERARLRAELETVEAALAYHLKVLAESVP
jgi:hypothetical protein